MAGDRIYDIVKPRACVSPGFGPRLVPISLRYFNKGGQTWSPPTHAADQKASLTLLYQFGSLYRSVLFIFNFTSDTRSHTRGTSFANSSFVGFRIPFSFLSQRSGSECCFCNVRCTSSNVYPPSARKSCWQLPAPYLPMVCNDDITCSAWVIHLSAMAAGFCTCQLCFVSIRVTTVNISSSALPRAAARHRPYASARL